MNSKENCSLFTNFDVERRRENPQKPQKHKVRHTFKCPTTSNYDFHHSHFDYIIHKQDRKSDERFSVKLPTS